MKKTRKKYLYLGKKYYFWILFLMETKILDRLVKFYF